MHGSGQGEIAALGERCNYQTRITAQVLVAIEEGCTHLK